MDGRFLMEVIREWAGKDRLFQLRTGEVLDLEQGCDAGIGVIYARLIAGQFWARDVMNALRLGLIGGGMDKLQAKALVDAHFGRIPMIESAALAAEIVIAVMTGVEPSEGSDEGEPADRLLFSDLGQISRVFNLSPVDLRQMPFADLLNLMRGYSAAGAAGRAPSEAEFEDMLAAYYAKEDAK
ncbi:gene transfer agent family protein [Rhodobacter sp. NTK016B]|uniref:gene transfer agent family protein n=1 Tax=Rhodobacter sp. NTK016B TaxID=2759676 RepID=UPI001A8C0E89|nr:gene transfer agent family protein [Rhodobacter sp. NTK016B]MBN8292805.1 gene transfer agent family protein [Rhodobacter sp. NTK016B]